MESGIAFGVTQPPLNPLEQASYEVWKGLADELSLPCLFEMGKAAGLKFADNMAAAEAVITTSVAEGFGMVFLEAWLAGRPLIGRDLPEITGDFVRAGVQLDALYSRLDTPVDWVGKDEFHRSMESAYRQVLAAFGQPIPSQTALAEELDALIRDGCVDFAALSRQLQGKVIRKVREDRRCRDALLERNPQIAIRPAPVGKEAEQLIEDNADAVRRGFSLESAGRRLHQLYREVAQSPREALVEPPMHGDRILAAFLSLSRLQPLRIEP
jgi:glycosyltransferase involved in cell wall biosynthesis